jgi:hypothetical protein
MHRAPLRYALAALALSLVSAAACERSPFVPPLASTPYDEYRAAYEKAVCEWQVRCTFAASVESCGEASLSDREGHYLDAAVAAGTIKYDGVSALACLEELAGVSCDRDESLSDQAPSCELVFEGLVPPDEPCMIGDECVLNGVCGVAPGCEESCCPGRCRVVDVTAELGESCTNNNVTCAAGTYCAQDPESGQRTVCAAQRPLSAACSDDFNACEDDLFCDGLACQPRRLAGESCADAACARGLTCAYIDDFTQTCIAPAELGEPCEPNAYQGACIHLAARCRDDSRVCELLGDVGQPCQGGCRAYTFCDYQSDTCRAYAGLNEPCGWFPFGDYDGLWIECAGDLECDAVDNDGLCVTRQYPQDLCEVPYSAPEA